MAGTAMAASRKVGSLALRRTAEARLVRPVVHRRTRGTRPGAVAEAGEEGAGGRASGHGRGREARRGGRQGHRPCARLAAAAADSAMPSEVPPSGNEATKFAAFVGAVWKFVRPHTIRGTILGTTALVARALLECDPALINWKLLPTALMGLFALLCGNGFIVGINQIYDVSIDTVNKPFLPIASGELSTAKAWALCTGMAAAGMVAVLLNYGALISSLYAFGLFIGWAYSVPPLRLKRSAFMAFLCIATVRGFLLNFGVHYATQAALHGWGRGVLSGVFGGAAAAAAATPIAWSPPVIFITVFVTVFATAIAVTKDLPDAEGDRREGVVTFTTRFGVPAVATAGTALLLANYVLALSVAFANPAAAFHRPLFMAVAHAVFALYLLFARHELGASGCSSSAVKRFYQRVWHLFYAEYVCYPFL